MRFITKSFTKGQKGFKGLKRLTFAVSLATTLMFSHSTFAQGAPNTVLYDTTGASVAYLETANGTLVMYNVLGDPLAYVSDTGAVYTFGGKQIGWYNGGVVYDMNGYQLAFPDTQAPQTVVIKKVQTTEAPTYKPVPNRTVVTETTTTTVTKPAFSQQVSPQGFSSVFTITPAQ